jgi:hypothetical protein
MQVKETYSRYSTLTFDEDFLLKLMENFLLLETNIIVPPRDEIYFLENIGLIRILEAGGSGRLSVNATKEGYRFALKYVEGKMIPDIDSAIREYINS